MVARWTHFPGSGLVAMVILIGWVTLGTAGLALAEPSRLSALLRLHAPAVTWMAWDGPPDQFPTYQPEGSPLAHLGYVTSLCVLGAVVAMLHDAQGEQRRRLVRALIITVVVTLVCLALTAAPDPVRTILVERG